MFLCPAGWREWRAGDQLIYNPREGKLHCVMTYRERVTPIRAFPKLLHETLAQDLEFVPEVRNKITRFITDEGEYAALIVVRGAFRGRKIGHVVAAVYGDDFSTLLDARVEGDYVDEYAQHVLDLVKTDRLELGIRRRRVGFKPPAGWHPVVGLGLEVALLPPDYPVPHASIVVYPARPLAGAQDPHEIQVLHDQRVGLGTGPEARSAAEVGELRGEEWRMVRALPGDAGGMVRFLVVLRDGRYLYTAKLEALEGLHVHALHATFSEMISTFEPIPAPVVGRRAGTSIFEMWSD